MRLKKFCTSATSFFSTKFGIDKEEIKKAIYKADDVQVSFERQLIQAGKDYLAKIPGKCRPVVLLGRPYNSTDVHLNLGLVEKLIAQNVMPIPVDMLDLTPCNIFVNYRNSFLQKLLINRSDIFIFYV